MLLAKGLCNILDALCEGSNITSLNLKGNNINGAVVAQLGKIFLHNNTLKQLSIEWNSLGTDTEAFAKFCEGLSMNHNIEELDLRYNQISPHCSAALAKALRTNKSLKTVDLAWNTLGLQGGQQLLTAMRENRSIKKLNLRGNCIPEEIINEIDECIHKNQCKNTISESNIFETVEAAKIAMVQNEKFESTLYKSTNDHNLLVNETVKKRLNFTVPNEPQENVSKVENSILTKKIVGGFGDVESDNDSRDADAKSKISELNNMLKDRTTAIDMLTKELNNKVEEANGAKISINRLENEIRELKEERETLILEKTRDVEEAKESQKHAEDRWKKECNKLEESLKETSLREKELATRIQRYERDIRKSANEIAMLKEKSLSQKQTYEDLMAKCRIEIHRGKRELKERENRHKIELNVLKNTLKESTEALEECQAQLQKSRSELRETLENLSSVKTRLTEIERVNCRLVRIEESFQKLKDEKKLLEEKLLDSQTMIAMLQRQVGTLQGELIEPQRRYGLVKDELEQEKEKTGRLRQELAEERARLQEFNHQTQSLNAQITALNNQINEIQSNHVEALRERDKERKILKDIIMNKERDFNELK